MPLALSLFGSGLREGRGLLIPYPSFQAPVRRPRDEPMRCTLVSSLLRSAMHSGKGRVGRGLLKRGFPKLRCWLATRAAGDSWAVLCSVQTCCLRTCQPTEFRVPLFRALPALCSHHAARVDTFGVRITSGLSASQGRRC